MEYGSDVDSGTVVLDVVKMSSPVVVSLTLTDVVSSLAVVADVSFVGCKRFIIARLLFKGTIYLLQLKVNSVLKEVR